MPTNKSINQQKYDSTHCKYMSLKLNLRTDSDIISKLSSVPSMQGYIKDLIRADIARNPVPDFGEEIVRNGNVFSIEKEETVTMTIRDDLSTFGITRFDDYPEVGQEYAIAEKYNIMTGAKTYVFRLIRNDGSDGFPGNSYPYTHYFHGWRGTTDNVAFTALGVFRILDIVEQKNGRSRIKLSADLHPDWE